MDVRRKSEYLYLPDDCWELIFKFINNNDDDDDDYDTKNRYLLKSMSTVSKYFFSVTNRLRSSLTILNTTTPFLTNLFHRFTNLTSLDLTHFQGDLDVLLSQIPPLKNLTSLNLSHQPSLPANGLRAFSKRITTLTSLISTNLYSSFNYTDLFLIAECFPLLEVLNLDHANIVDILNTGYIDGIEVISLSLVKLRKLNLDGHDYIMFKKKCIYYLYKNCKFLEEANCYVPSPVYISAFCEHKPTMLKSLFVPFMFTPQIIHLLKNLTSIDFSFFDNISDEILSSIVIADIPLRRIVLHCSRGFSYAGLFGLLSKYGRSIQHLDLVCSRLLNDDRVVELSSVLVGLVSLNLGISRMLTYSSLFALLSKCHLLSEIKMENIGRRSVDDNWTKGNFRVYPQLKSLYLPGNSWLGYKHIKMFAYVFPNLRLFNLCGCNRISARSMRHLLRRFPKITHLNVKSCDIYYEISIRMIFQVPNLKILDLASSTVNDELLYTISKTCSGLLQLILTGCTGCTEIGVKHVIENCTQLKEIDLRRCTSVHTNVFASMLFLKSLRKITAAPTFHFTETQRELFLLQGCILC